MRALATFIFILMLAGLVMFVGSAGNSTVNSINVQAGR